MKIMYIISCLFLIISFLIYYKNDKPVSIISSTIFSVCLFICYQTTLVCIFSYFCLGGTLFYYGVFNFFVGIILLFVCIKRKKIQKYFFSKKELFLFLAVLIFSFFVVCYRFRGFNSISYASDDVTIHYRAALSFSNTLEKLTNSNSRDIIFGSFGNMMPISYITGGMFLHLFSNFSNYKVFLVYDCCCCVLYTLLFLATMLQIFEKKKYVYLFVITILYGLGFPLNNLIFGFCYLGLGVMVINLIIYFFCLYKDDLKSDSFFKNIILFILCFSVFFSYYLFMPFVYLALGLYYIYLYLKRRISFNLLAFYYIITLFIPFGIGCLTYIRKVEKVVSGVALNGDIYNNVTPILFFFVISYCYFLYQVKRKEKVDFFKISFITLSCYIFLFFILYLCKIVSFYYFCKLFYVYWVYALLFLGTKFDKYYKIFSVVFIVVLVGSLFVVTSSNQRMIRFLCRLNVYYYNAVNYRDEFIRFKKGDLQLVDAVLNNKDMCEYNHEIPVIGYYSKNMWFYSIVGSVPVINHVEDDYDQMYVGSLFFNHWETLKNYPCVLYFNDVANLNYDKNKYEAILENDRGVLLKRKTVE